MRSLVVALLTLLLSGLSSYEVEAGAFMSRPKRSTQENIGVVDEFVHKVMRKAGIPGVSISVVHNDKVESCVFVANCSYNIDLYFIR